MPSIRSIRPQNARADDQLRRNHTTQYASLSEYTRKRLREDSPGEYESYADLYTWIKFRFPSTDFTDTIRMSFLLWLFQATDI